MRPLATPILATMFATATFWSLFGAAVFGAAVFGTACAPDALDDPEPVARLVASWDPLACGDEPHRVVLDLEDESGNRVTSSTPCWLGGIAVDLPSWGPYVGRVYSWTPEDRMHSVSPLSLSVDQAVMRVEVATPP